MAAGRPFRVIAVADASGLARERRPHRRPAPAALERALDLDGRGGRLPRRSRRRSVWSWNEADGAGCEGDGNTVVETRRAPTSAVASVHDAHAGPRRRAPPSARVRACKFETAGTNGSSVHVHLGASRPASRNAPRAPAGARQPVDPLIRHDPRARLPPSRPAHRVAESRRTRRADRPPRRSLPMSGLKGLEDQVVVLTGASSGIGLATARRLGARGAKLVLVARNDEGARRDSPPRSSRRAVGRSWRWRTSGSATRWPACAPAPSSASAGSIPGSTTPASRDLRRGDRRALGGPAKALRHELLGRRRRLARGGGAVPRAARGRRVGRRQADQRRARCSRTGR